MSKHTKYRVKTVNVPGVGMVTASIGYVTQADGTEVNHFLSDARYADGGRPVENEHRAAVGRAVNAFV